MCSIGWHICGCGNEYKCDQPDRECPDMNGFDDLCGHCQLAGEYAEEEHERELDRERQRKWEEEEWMREFGWDV